MIGVLRHGHDDGERAARPVHGHARDGLAMALREHLDTVGEGATRGDTRQSATRGILSIHEIARLLGGGRSDVGGGQIDRLLHDEANIVAVGTRRSGAWSAFAAMDSCHSWCGFPASH